MGVLVGAATDRTGAAGVYTAMRTEDAGKHDELKTVDLRS